MIDVLWVAILALLVPGDVVASQDTLTRHGAAAATALNSGDYAAAEKHNRALIAADPRIAEAYTNLGLSCYLQKNYSAAIEAFERGLKLKPTMANAWLFLGIAQFNLNRPARALPALKKYTAMRPGDFQGHYYLGLSLLTLDRYAEAASALTMAKTIDPKNIDALYHLAQSVLRQAENKTEAERVKLWPAYETTVKEIAGLDPNSYRIRQLRAGYYEAIKETGKAIAELQAIATENHQVRGLHYTLGCLLMQTFEYDRALAEFEAELRVEAPYPRTWLQIGHVHLAKQSPELAFPYLERAREEEPETALPWVELGRYYRMSENHVQAVVAYRKAIDLGEKKPSVYFQVGTAYRKIGRMDLAREFFKLSEQMTYEQNAHSVEKMRQAVDSQPRPAR